MMMDDNDDTKTEQPGLDELITLGEAAKMSGLSQAHLRLLVSRKAMWGKKLGRNWFTTVRAVEEYLKLERKPGPKPQK